MAYCETTQLPRREPRFLDPLDLSDELLERLGRVLPREELPERLGRALPREPELRDGGAAWRRGGGAGRVVRRGGAGRDGRLLCPELPLRASSSLRVEGNGRRVSGRVLGVRASGRREGGSGRRKRRWIGSRSVSRVRGCVSRVVRSPAIPVMRAPTAGKRWL